MPGPFEKIEHHGNRAPRGALFSCDAAYLCCGREFAVRHDQIVGKNRCKSPRFVMIVQQDNRNDPQRLPARAALRYLALQIL
jgi:hypothetical protein